MENERFLSAMTAPTQPRQRPGDSPVRVVRVVALGRRCLPRQIVINQQKGKQGHQVQDGKLEHFERQELVVRVS